MLSFMWGQLRSAIVALGLTALCHDGRAEPLQEPPLIARPPMDAAAELEKEGSLASLVKAVLLRRASSAYDVIAADDIDRAIAKLTAARTLTPADAQAAADLLQDVLDLEDRVDEEIWQPRLLRFIRAMTNTGQYALRLRAQVRLAAHLWERSCPVVGQDGACIERMPAAASCTRSKQTRLAELVATKGARLQSPLECDPPHYSYRVYARNKTLVDLAQGMLKDSLSQAAAAHVTPQKPGDEVDEALAHARFLLAEPYFEAALANVPYPGSPGVTNPQGYDPGNPRERKHAMQQYLRWWKQHAIDRQETLRHREQIESPLAHPNTAWAVASRSRMAQLFLDAVDQTYGCYQPLIHGPPPRGIKPDDWAKGVGKGYCGGTFWTDLLFARPTQEYLEKCVESAAELLIDTPQSRFCSEAAHQIRPLHYDAPMREILPCSAVACEKRPVFSVPAGTP